MRPKKEFKYIDADCAGYVESADFRELKAHLKNSRPLKRFTWLGDLSPPRECYKSHVTYFACL